MSGRRVKRERGTQVPRRARASTRWRIAGGAAGLAVAVGLGLALALTRGGSTAASSAAAVRGGTANAPLELSGTDPITGRSVSLAAYAGKPIVLNLWASWCTGCYAEAHALAAFERTHPQAQVVGVDIQDTPAAAQAFYRRFGWRHPSVFDPSGTIAARFRLQGLPATLFLDRQHHIVARILGETNLAGFDQGLRRALS